MPYRVVDHRLQIEQPRGLRVWLRLRWLEARLVVGRVGGALRRGAAWAWERRPFHDERWEPETVARLRKQFAEGQSCEMCGGIHLGKCPRIKRAVLNASGHVTEVEFWPWREWPRDRIIWPDDLPRGH